jgi:hypothetical protein
MFLEIVLPWVLLFLAAPVAVVAAAVTPMIIEG